MGQTSRFDIARHITRHFTRHITRHITRDGVLRSAPIIAALLAVLLSEGVCAHGVAEDDKAFIEQTGGMRLLPFIYLGAKHMVTGYDHLLFLFGVIFFLYRMKDIGVYVTLFALGHSTTLLFGVLTGTHVNPYIVDTIIGLSVVYKALDNLGAFERVLGFQPNTRSNVCWVFNRTPAPLC